MNDGWCLECGEEFHFDDTGGYNPPCYCKTCGGAVCRSCHPWNDGPDDDEPDARDFADAPQEESNP